jgi:hypothetical protein
MSERDEIDRLREAIFLALDPMCIGKVGKTEYFRDTEASRRALVRLRAALTTTTPPGSERK